MGKFMERTNQKVADCLFEKGILHLLFEIRGKRKEKEGLKVLELTSK